MQRVAAKHSISGRKLYAALSLPSNSVAQLHFFFFSLSLSLSISLSLSLFFFFTIHHFHSLTFFCCTNFLLSMLFSFIIRKGCYGKLIKSLSICIFFFRFIFFFIVDLFHFEKRDNKGSNTIFSQPLIRFCLFSTPLLQPTNYKERKKNTNERPTVERVGKG